MKNLKTILLLSLTVAAVALVFEPVYRAGFTNYDDDVLVTENRLIKEISPGTLKSVFLSPYLGLYHPAVLLSYAAEYALSGLNPLTYHLTNLLLHSANTLLVFWMILLISKNRPAAFLTALLFGVHPMHVESVAWIAERKDVLYAFFYLSSMVAYVYAKRGGSKNLLAASFVFFLLSLMSKPMAVTLPLALMLVDHAETGKWNWRSFTEKIPFFALSLLFGAVALGSHYKSPDSLEPASFSLASGLANAVSGASFYAVKLAYPSRLSCFYPYSGAEWKNFFIFWPALPVLLACAAGLAVYRFRRNRAVVFGAAFFVTALLPVLQLVPFGQKIPADRFTYLASIGLFYIAAEGFSALWGGRNAAKRVFAAAAAATAVMLLSFGANARCRVWQDSFTLWNDTIKKYPGLPQAYKNRADAYKYAGEPGKALEDYGRALAAKADYPQALNNRGNLYASLGDFRKAIEDYSSAILENPGYVSAIYNRAIALAALGRYDEAAADYSLAIEKDPDYQEAFNNRGVIRARLGNYGPAIEDFDEAISLNKGFNEAYANRALAHYGAGNYAGAEKDVKLLMERKQPVNAGFQKALIDKRAAQEQDRPGLDLK